MAHMAKMAKKRFTNVRNGFTKASGMPKPDTWRHRVSVLKASSLSISLFKTKMFTCKVAKKNCTVKMVLFTSVKMHKWWSVKDSWLPLFEHRNNKVQTQPAFCSHWKEEISLESFGPDGRGGEGVSQLCRTLTETERERQRGTANSFPLPQQKLSPVFRRREIERIPWYSFYLRFCVSQLRLGIPCWQQATQKPFRLGFHGQRNCFHKRSKEVMQFP